jgi:hypothetical protein
MAAVATTPEEPSAERAREDLDRAETQGLAMLREASEAMVAGVRRCLPGWVTTRVAVIADAWGRLDASARAELDARARQAATATSARVVAELEALLGRDPSAQDRTPLEVVRSAYREPTELLAGAGIPGVVRDEFAERAWPEDRYGLVPAGLGDLGDPDLGPLLLAWGMAKAKVIRARIDRDGLPD